MAGTDRTFALRLVELRRAAGLSREALADRSGLSYGSVRDYEQSRREPTWGSLLALARALGVSVGAFEEPPARDVAMPRAGRPRQTPVADRPRTATGKPKGKKGSGGR
jgi:transcriptional regulator with XRE-family HTH domain